MGRRVLCVGLEVDEVGENSSIEWTDHTWNPWRGCTKISPGCQNCYMFRDMARTAFRPDAVQQASPLTFTKPLKWEGPARVFTCSWGDFFHPMADPYRHDAWEIIRQRDDLTFLILTKRPQLVADRLPDDWPLLNVWLGVSVEDQRRVHRIDEILAVDTVVHFVSLEPLLEAVDLVVPARDYDDTYMIQMLDWVIVGGESGPNHRPMKTGWARQIRDDCKQFNVPFFFKQWGGWPDKRGGGKAKLDGELHHEMPKIWMNEKLRRSS